MVKEPDKKKYSYKRINKKVIRRRPKKCSKD